MQVKGKLFPYPVLNKDTLLSNYVDKVFNLIYQKEENNAIYALKNARFETNSQLINNLYDSGKISVNCIIECSDTVYRKCVSISKEPQDIILPKVDFSERVDISMFATANESFILESEEFETDYQNVEFEVEKYDIIAANDGFNVRFKHDESEDSFAESIFSIIICHDFEAGAYTVECNTGKKIVVTLSEEDYKNYKIIYTIPAYKEVFFNVFLIPALIEGLTQCKQYLNEDTSRDIEDVSNQFLWFRAIVNGYKKLKGTDLSVDAFNRASLSFMAQELLGKPLGEALSKLVITAKGIGGLEND